MLYLASSIHVFNSVAIHSSMWLFKYARLFPCTMFLYRVDTWLYVCVIKSQKCTFALVSYLLWWLVCGLCIQADRVRLSSGKESLKWIVDHNHKCLKESGQDGINAIWHHCSIKHVSTHTKTKTVKMSEALISLFHSR